MKPKALATVLFAAVGVYAIVEGIILLQPLGMITVVWIGPGGQSGGHTGKFIAAFGVGLICPLVLFALGSWLLLRPPMGILGKRIAERDAPASRWPCKMLLRASMMVIGTWVLCRVSPKMINLVYVLTMENDSFAEVMRRGLWPNLAQVAVGVVLGVYLFSGAPHLVRWMARRIERLGDRDDDEDDTPQSRPRITT